MTVKELFIDSISLLKLLPNDVAFFFVKKYPLSTDFILVISSLTFAIS